MDVADWESQREVFQDAINTLGKIDYVFPIAGITEHKWLPNNPDPDGVFHEPNLSVIDVDIKGVLHSVALAVQHFRHERSEGRNVRAKSVSHSATGALYMPSIQESRRFDRRIRARYRMLIAACISHNSGLGMRVLCVSFPTSLYGGKAVSS